MEHLHILFPLLALLQLAHPQNATEKKTCVLNKLKTVSFPTLEAYQSSKFTFNPAKLGYLGNSIDFTFISIDRLPRNVFISYESDNLLQIDMEGKQIQKIDGGAFNQLFCLHYLKLKRNNISSLTEDAFQGLENLRSLDLSENLLERIDAMVFYHLNHLEVLDLSKNKIRVLSSLSFTNLTSLSVLDLSYNLLRSLSPNMFAPLTSLKELRLKGNRLSGVEPEKWIGLQKLQLLDLSNNYLSRFDTSSNFSFSNLQSLNLSGNYITYLDAFDMRKNLPKLKVIDVTENDWLCETLEVLKHNLFGAQISFYGTVNCSVSGVYKPSTTTQAPTTGTQRTTTLRSKDYSKEVYLQNAEILYTNKEVLDNMQHLENVLVCLFVLVIIFAVVEMGLRMGICRSVYSRMVDRNHGYIDNSDREHLVLMRR